MLVNYRKLSVRPRVYNHERIYHPNISVCTCEVIVPELIEGWNPAFFLHIFLSIRQTLMYPNPNCIPNTHLNKQAGWNYDKNRHRYKLLL